jgi:DHA1 family multidrug resistance protein-like MFS transporter
MPEIIRDGALGQLVRRITKNKVFPYPEEQSDFTPPDHYRGSSASSTYDRTTSTAATLVANTNPTTSYLSIEEKEEIEVEAPPAIPASAHTRDVDQTLNQVTSKLDDEVANTEKEDLYQARTQRDLEALTDRSVHPHGSRLIRPDTLKDGTVLVTWYTEDDPANPQNWSSGKKVFVTGESDFVECRKLSADTFKRSSCCILQLSIWAVVSSHLQKALL